MTSALVALSDVTNFGHYPNLENTRPYASVAIVRVSIVRIVIYFNYGYLMSGSSNKQNIQLCVNSLDHTYLKSVYML